MAITIPRDSEVPSARDILFHRHCQKTVCSAHGYQGGGKTWDILTREPSLSALEMIYRDWVGLFERNDSNITEDLRTILELIDKVAAKINEINGISAFTIGFKTPNNTGGYKDIGTKTFGNGTGQVLNWSFALGRNITIKINDESIKFNTLTSSALGDEEKLNITLPEKKLTLKVGTFEIGSASVVASKASTITLSTKKFTVKTASKTFGSVSIPMESDSTVTLNTQTFTFKKDAQTLYTASGILAEQNGNQTITFQQEYNLVTASVLPIDTRHFSAASESRYDFYKINLRPDTHVYRIFPSQPVKFVVLEVGLPSATYFKKEVYRQSDQYSDLWTDSTHTSLKDPNITTHFWDILEFEVHVANLNSNSGVPYENFYLTNSLNKTDPSNSSEYDPNAQYVNDSSIHNVYFLVPQTWLAADQDARGWITKTIPYKYPDSDAGNALAQVKDAFIWNGQSADSTITGINYSTMVEYSEYFKTYQPGPRIPEISWDWTTDPNHPSLSYSSTYSETLYDWKRDGVVSSFLKFLIPPGHMYAFKFTLDRFMKFATIEKVRDYYALSKNMRPWVYQHTT